MAKATSMTDALFAKFEGRIVSGQLAPGQRLPSQKDIAAEEEVSRTVVREAVARLQAQGYAQARHGSGVYVSPDARYRAFQVTRTEMADIADVIRLLEMRLAVEAEMAALAADRRSAGDLRALADALDRISMLNDDPGAALEVAEADSAFHLAIARATGNDYYVRFIDFLGVRLVPPRSIYLRFETAAAQQAYAAKVQAEHVAILDAIEQGDSIGARAAARHHMQESLIRHSAAARSMPDVRWEA